MQATDKTMVAEQKVRSTASAGFTIVETLIVLAVTGILFLSAINVFAGKQHKTEFNQAINSVKGQIDQTINEVSSGYYPNDNDFSCRASGSIIDITKGAVPGNSGAQGTNVGCTFLGKVMHFYDSTSPVADSYNTYTVVGAQFTGASFNQVATNLSEVAPELVATSSVPSPAVPANLNGESAALQYGLHVVSMQYDDGSGGPKPAAAVGFISSLGQNTADVTKLMDGASQANLIAAPKAVLGETAAQGIDSIDTYFKNLSHAAAGDDDPTINPSGGVAICFASGGTDQSGKITIGGSDQGLATNLQIFNGTKC